MCTASLGINFVNCTVNRIRAHIARLNMCDICYNMIIETISWIVFSYIVSLYVSCVKNNEYLHLSFSYDTRYCLINICCDIFITITKYTYLLYYVTNESNELTQHVKEKVMHISKSIHTHTHMNMLNVNICWCITNLHSIGDIYDLKYREIFLNRVTPKNKSNIYSFFIRVMLTIVFLTEIIPTFSYLRNFAIATLNFYLILTII